MINERLEVQNYLIGKNINKRCLYRICYQLAKWYKQQGLSHIEIRQAIFDWGKTYNVFIEYNLNGIIYQAMEDKEILKSPVIKINEQDIKEIKDRFDSKNVRLTALAMLCYAKAFADNNNEFTISVLALSAWVGIADTNLSGIYIKELIDFGFVDKINVGKMFTWNKKSKSKHVRYHINIPLVNEGNYELKDNDIKGLYNGIFC